MVVSRKEHSLFSRGDPGVKKDELRWYRGACAFVLNLDEAFFYFQAPGGSEPVRPDAKEHE
jgi:hypothetical protein